MTLSGPTEPVDADPRLDRAPGRPHSELDKVPRIIHRLLRKGNYAKRVGAGAPAYMAVVIEYLAAGILELAGNEVRDNKKTRIISATSSWPSVTTRS